MSSDDEVEVLVDAIERRNDNRHYLMRCFSRACPNVALDGELVCEKHVRGAIATIAFDELLEKYGHVLKKERVAVPIVVVDTKRELKKVLTKKKKAVVESESESESTSDDDVVEVARPRTADKPKNKASAPLCKDVNKKGEPCGNKTKSKSGYCHRHE